MEAPPNPGLGLVVAAGPNEALTGLENPTRGLASGDPIIDGEGGRATLLRGEPAKEGSEPLPKDATLPRSGELRPSDPTTGELPIMVDAGAIGEATGLPTRPTEVRVGVPTSGEGLPSGPLMLLQRDKRRSTTLHMHRRHQPRCTRKLCMY